MSWITAVLIALYAMWCHRRVTKLEEKFYKEHDSRSKEITAERAARKSQLKALRYRIYLSECRVKKVNGNIAVELPWRTTKKS